MDAARRAVAARSRGRANGRRPLGRRVVEQRAVDRHGARRTRSLRSWRRGAVRTRRRPRERRDRVAAFDTRTRTAAGETPTAASATSAQRRSPGRRWRSPSPRRRLRIAREPARKRGWRTRAGGIDPPTLARAIVARYGRDRTFSVPILTMCALGGRLGSGQRRGGSSSRSCRSSSAVDPAPLVHDHQPARRQLRAAGADRDGARPASPSAVA